MADQVVENGEVKSRRKILRPLAKAASIMEDIAEATEDVVVAEADIEDEEAMAEMANQDEDVGDIAVEAIHRPLRSNHSLATIWTKKGAFFAMYQNPTCTTISFFGFRIHKKAVIRALSERFSLLAMHFEILETRLDVFE